MTEAIRRLLREHGRLAEDVASLTTAGDLFEAGLTSHASVNLMLALEEHFEVEFPERMLHRRTFASIAAIRVLPERARRGERMSGLTVASDLLEAARRIGARRRGTAPRRRSTARRVFRTRPSPRCARSACSARSFPQELGGRGATIAEIGGGLRDARPVLRVDGDDLRHAPDRSGVPGAPRPAHRLSSAATWPSSPSASGSSRRRRQRLASAATFAAVCARSSATGPLRIRSRRLSSLMARRRTTSC